VASDLKLDHTATSNLLLAHSSTFWIRAGDSHMPVLNHIVSAPGRSFLPVNQKPAVPEGREFTELTIPRLRRLRELCDANESG